MIATNGDPGKNMAPSIGDAALQWAEHPWDQQDKAKDTSCLRVRPAHNSCQAEALEATPAKEGNGPFIDYLTRVRDRDPQNAKQNKRSKYLIYICLR